MRTDGESFQLLGRESGVRRQSPTSRTFPATPGSRSPPAREAASPWQERSASDDSPPATAPRRRSPSNERGSGSLLAPGRNFASADAFDCDKLIAVEVITPGGNWSSYPPHKHDEHRPGEESELEEIYYFEIDGPHGFGYQRVSPSREGGSDVLAEVRSGDAVLVPDGWHGPSIAQPGHAMYYLNVMAGPGETREWRICFHPAHAEGGYR